MERICKWGPLALGGVFGVLAQMAFHDPQAARLTKILILVGAVTFAAWAAVIVVRAFYGWVRPR